MMTMREAKQRIEHLNARMNRTAAGDIRCTLNEWRGDEAERKAYYTDDPEDAYFTLSDMRRRQNAASS